MNKYIVLLLAAMGMVQQANAFRIEYRIPPGGSMSGNRWAVSAKVEDATPKKPKNLKSTKIFGSKKYKITLNSCADHGGSCNEEKYNFYPGQQLQYYIEIKYMNATPARDKFKAPCNAIITYVYDNQTNSIYRADNLKIKKAWLLRGNEQFVAQPQDDRIGKSLAEVYPNSATYWNTKPVDQCPN